MKTDDATQDAKKRAAVDRQLGHIDFSSNKQSDASVQRNVQAIIDLERKSVDDRRQYSRLSELVTRMAASPAFIAAHVLAVSGWIIFNATHAGPDPRPFGLLNLALMFESIILTSIVLVAQRDLQRLGDLRAHLDLQVNILAEQELTTILSLLNEVCARLGIDAKKAEPNAEDLAKETDVRSIANAIENTLDE